MHLFMAQIASGGEGGNVLAGLFILGCGIWFLAYVCRPKNKGWDVRHQGQTTIKPRK